MAAVIDDLCPNPVCRLPLTYELWVNEADGWRARCQCGLQQLKYVRSTPEELVDGLFACFRRVNHLPELDPHQGRVVARRHYVCKWLVNGHECGQEYGNHRPHPPWDALYWEDWRGHVSHGPMRNHANGHLRLRNEELWNDFVQGRPFTSNGLTSSTAAPRPVLAAVAIDLTMDDEGQEDDDDDDDDDDDADDHEDEVVERVEEEDADAADVAGGRDDHNDDEDDDGQRHDGELALRPFAWNPLPAFGDNGVFVADGQHGHPVDDVFRPNPNPFAEPAEFDEGRAPGLFEELNARMEEEMELEHALIRARWERGYMGAADLAKPDEETKAKDVQPMPCHRCDKAAVLQCTVGHGPAETKDSTSDGGSSKPPVFTCDKVRRQSFCVECLTDVASPAGGTAEQLAALLEDAQARAAWQCPVCLGSCPCGACKARARKQKNALARKGPPAASRPGPDIDKARALHDLARERGSKGDYMEQRRLLEQALAIKLRYYGGDEHIDVARTLHQLASVHGSLGDCTTQRRLLEQVLAIQRRQYGDDDVATAGVLRNLADVHGTLGEIAEQRRLLQQVLSIQRRLYGNDEHVDVVSTLHDLALLSTSSPKPSPTEQTTGTLPPETSADVEHVAAAAEELSAETEVDALAEALGTLNMAAAAKG